MYFPQVPGKMYKEVKAVDSNKTGKLIAALRREKGFTQKALAEKMHISDRTISKWERAAGCPDISLLPQLAEILGVSMENILASQLEPNTTDGGNMRKIKFYVCPACGNVLFATGEGEISCCGRRLEALKPQNMDDSHKAAVEEIENDYYITLAHPMGKEHYITFAAYVCYDRVLLVKLYPEQSAEVRFPKMRRGQLYLCCSREGLFQQSI